MSTKYRRSSLCLLFVLLLFVIPGIVAACGEPRPQNGEPPPLPGESKTGNPKLSSQLNQLVQAESRGETVSFAKQHNIELIDKKVRVVVETLPGQLEVVRQAVTRVGTVEANDGNLLQAVVPIARLNALAGEPAIKFIRLPMTPAPGAGGVSPR